MSVNKSVYLAIHAEALTELPDTRQLELMLNLTPKVMRWSDDTWLLDLGVCHSYWHTRATSLNSDTNSLWRSLLHQLLVPNSSSGAGASYIGNSAPYHAVLSDQPWTGLLLLNYLRERSIRGFIDVNSAFGQTLYNDLSWASWWKNVEQITPHLTRLYPSFDVQGFHQSSRKMQQAMTRLSSQQPRDMRSVDAASIKRRFGSWLSQLWSWSAPNLRAAGSLFDDASAFPWHSEKKQDAPHLTRHLETSAYEWSHLEKTLQEDLNRLCQIPTWDFTDRVTVLRWVITLDDMTQRELSIHFRHPHNLHSQVPEQKTALVQANYSFSDLVAKEAISAPIVGWKLTVAERLLVSTELGAIFEQATNQALADLLELENQLPVALEAYDLRADWQPEDSFAITNTQATQQTPSLPVSSTQKPSYYALAKIRPLYLLKAPEAIKDELIFEREAFLERTMQKWWSKTEAKTAALCRSYYRLRLATGQSVWAFHDEQNHWFVHGIFA